MYVALKHRLIRHPLHRGWTDGTFVTLPGFGERNPAVPPKFLWWEWALDPLRQKSESIVRSRSHERKQTNKRVSFPNFGKIPQFFKLISTMERSTQDESTQTRRSEALSPPTGTSPGGTAPAASPQGDPTSGSEAGGEGGGATTTTPPTEPSQLYTKEVVVTTVEEDEPVWPFFVFLFLLFLCGGVLALRYGYFAWRRRMYELAVYQQMVKEGKAEEATGAPPLAMRLVTLFAMGVLFALYLVYIRRRNARREEIQSDYRNRQIWMFILVILSILGLFFYLHRATHFGTTTASASSSSSSSSTSVSSSSVQGAGASSAVAVGLGRLLGANWPVIAGLLLAAGTNMAMKTPTPTAPSLPAEPPSVVGFDAGPVPRPGQWQVVPCTDLGPGGEAQAWSQHVLTPLGPGFVSSKTSHVR